MNSGLISMWIGIKIIKNFCINHKYHFKIMHGWLVLLHSIQAGLEFNPTIKIEMQDYWDR